MMKTNIQIDNLKCGGCASTISKAVSSIKGVSSVNVELETETVQVELDNETILPEIKQKLKSLGYPEKGSVEGLEKLTTGAKSYVSCAIGKLTDH